MAIVMTTTSDGSGLTLGGGSATNGLIQLTKTCRSNTEIQTTAANGFRIARTKFGFIFRNDDESFYILPTRENDAYGSYNGNVIPFRINVLYGNIYLKNASLDDKLQWGGHVKDKPGRIAYNLPWTKGTNNEKRYVYLGSWEKMINQTV